MKTKKQKETNEKEVHLLEQKGYERMVNEIVPMQQVEACHNPTKKEVKEAVRKLNPDINSLGNLHIQIILSRQSYIFLAILMTG
ncbi:hypothetical protein IMSAGC001_01576 [Bacteroides acidifaciens]|uniref:Uncharacterized protein n=1 Tax=Bacteroides acidifaciens TaxID=85831 RepID=A0A7J0A229_9BACE|nr:hypothetical protein [Bacteroides acidifaciens]GFH86170.1 hypothetical protein IMSAGC001_01576 [Bacteroides acidifaciens]